MIERYIRDISPTLKTASLPDALVSRASREVEAFHHECNVDIKIDFARNFSAGDFKPSFRDDYRRATEAFFKTDAWARIKELRRHLSPREAAAPYDPTIARLPRPLRTKAERFLRSPAGQWWLASREGSWQRVLAFNTEAPGICVAASASFHRQLIGLLVEHGMTEPVQFRTIRRPVNAIQTK